MEPFVHFQLKLNKSLTTISMDSVSDVLATDADLPALMAQREMQASVQQVIASLPDRERQVTLLFYIGDYSQQEVADYLNIPVSTVKSRLHTARSHLRERMVQMVQENLQQQRPSKDERFVLEVIDVIETTEQGDLSNSTSSLNGIPALRKPKMSVQVQRKQRRCTTLFGQGTRKSPSFS